MRSCGKDSKETIEIDRSGAVFYAVGPEDTVEKLAASLEKALASLPRLEPQPYDLTWPIWRAHKNEEGADPALTALLAALRDVHELHVFNGDFMQIEPGQALRVDYGALANWILKRGQELGVQQVIEDLQTFIQSTEIPVLRMAAVEGLSISRECTVGAQLRLLPWEKISETPLKRYIATFWLQQGRIPSAAIVREFRAPKEQLLTVDSDSSPVFKMHFDDTELMLCAGLFGPIAPVVLASWTEYPPWFPRRGLGYSLAGPTDRSAGGEWPEEVHDEFPKLYERFQTLPNHIREHLRVPLDRLNKAMRRPFAVDAAIDLGIALESLFLTDLDEDRGELSFRLRLRAARYLAEDIGKRKQFARELSLLYKARSIAVHTGALPGRIESAETPRLLKTGYGLAANALKSMIENGVPDWQDVVFS